MQNLLEVRNVSKTLGDFTLSNISFSLPSGYILGLIGPNGAGKTTLIKLLLGLMTMDQGSVHIFGKDLTQHEADIKQQIGVVFDESHFYEGATVQQNHDFFSPFYREWDEAQFKNYIQRFRLPLNRKIKDLSKGMRMQFALAMALSHNARFLIMDEPTSGLDPLMRREMLEILQQYIADGQRSVLFSTHITPDLDRVADYIAFIHGGRLILNDSKDELLESHHLVKGGQELTSPPIRELLIGLESTAMGCVALTRQQQAVARLCRQPVVFDRPGLDDIMIHYAGRNRL